MHIQDSISWKSSRIAVFFIKQISCTKICHFSFQTFNKVLTMSIRGRKLTFLTASKTKAEIFLLKKEDLMKNKSTNWRDLTKQESASAKKRKISNFIVLNSPKSCNLNMCQSTIFISVPWIFNGGKGSWKVTLWNEIFTYWGKLESTRRTFNFLS